MYLYAKGAGTGSHPLSVPSGYSEYDASNDRSKQVTRSTQVINRKANIALMVILLGLCAACLFHLWFVLGRQLEGSAKTEHDMHVMEEHELKAPVEVVKLDWEDSFRGSVKTCLPTLNKMCQTYIANGIPRVAILAPPGDFGDWIFKWASKVVDTKLGSTAKMDLQLVSHVPPYGYGKTHGWTKLIRILPRTLMLGAADAIRGSLQLGQTQRDLTLRDLKAALRQVVRYHCRISHLAAHTAVLTLDMNSLAQVPYVASEGLLMFLNITAIDHGEMEDPDMEQKEDSHDAGRFFQREQDIIATSNNFESFAASLLTWIERHEEVNVKDELDLVLKEELTRSTNFSTWPCESLWTTGDGPNGLDLSPFGRRLAQSLAPDCDAPFTTCSVKKDRCEQAGDVFCKR